MTSGWSRFFLWVLIIGGGGVALAVTETPLRCCIGMEPCNACPLLPYAPMSWRAKTITAVNHCPTPVAVAVEYNDDKDLPQIAGWQEIPPDSSAQLHDGNGTPVISYGPNYDFKVVHSGERQSLPDPRRVDDMKTANIFNSPEAWWAKTTRMSVACP